MFISVWLDRVRPLRIQTILTGIDQNIVDKIMTNQKLLVQLLLDSSNMEELNSLQVDDINYRELETISKAVCFALHR